MFPSHPWRLSALCRGPARRLSGCTRLRCTWGYRRPLTLSFFSERMAMLSESCFASGSGTLGTTDLEKKSYVAATIASSSSDGWALSTGSAPAGSATLAWDELIAWVRHDVFVPPLLLSGSHSRWPRRAWPGRVRLRSPACHGRVGEPGIRPSLPTCRHPAHHTASVRPTS